MHQEAIILSSAYFGPVQYFSRFTLQKPVYIEQFDNYIKQTYRNRCVIGSAGGPLSLTIPVKRKKGVKTKVRDIRIDYDTNWRKLHRQGIISSYNSSPFFEYIRDDLEPFFTKKTEFLIDLNYSITLKIIELLGLNIKPELTIKFINSSEFPEFSDLRDLIHPKINIGHDHAFKPEPYSQVFSSKFGFIPNLSILDLLFNKGNEAITILKKSLQQESEQKYVQNINRIK